MSNYLDDEPGNDREKDSYWDNQWNLESEGLRQLLELTQVFDVKHRVCHGGRHCYEFQLSGSVFVGGGSGGFLRAIGREVERVRAALPKKD